MEVPLAYKSRVTWPTTDTLSEQSKVPSAFAVLVLLADAPFSLVAVNTTGVIVYGDAEMLHQLGSYRVRVKSMTVPASMVAANVEEAGSDLLFAADKVATLTLSQRH